MATRITASSVIALPIDTVWAALRNFTFPARLLPSVIQSCHMLDGRAATEVGAVREVRWKSGEVKTQRLIELSDQFHRITWETITAEPPSETAAAITSVKLYRITETNATLVEWSSDFSADVKGELIKFEQKAAQHNLLEIRANLKPHQTVLVLGSGLVARPLVHYLAEHGYHVIVASRTLEKIKKLIGTAKNVEAVQCDVETDADLKTLEQLTARSDLVVSMLPYLFHPRAAKFALQYGKHFLTTSYVSPAMRELEAEAIKKGLVMINECGVDPGTDHMSAMKVIHDVERRGGKIVSFTSYCGGLPAPDSNNNPFGYKLSWAPRGVLLASRNDAHFLRDGKEVSIPGKDLFDNFETHHIEGVGDLEAYPNRNSCQYIDIYKVPATRTMIRGTYRYKNWCPTIKKFVDLGLLDLTERTDLAGRSFKQVIGDLLGSKGDIAADAAAKLKIPVDHFSIKNMTWLGLFSDEKIGPKVNTLLDAVCQLFVEKLQYGNGERDMLVMRHTFVADFADKTETITSSLVDFGVPHGDTSMSRTVSLPVAIATRLVLEGKYTKPGLSVPTCPELYNPILAELETMNIKFVEKLVKSEPKK